MRIFLSILSSKTLNSVKTQLRIEANLNFAKTFFMKFSLLGICFFMAYISSAQSILLDENFSSGIPSTFAVINADNQTPAAAVSQFTDAFIWYNTTDDSSAASTSYYTNSDAQAEDYLILPKLTLQTVTKLSWEARSVDPSFPENYYVLLSTTDSLIGSFTDTLLTVTEENYQWTRKSILLDTMGFANQDVFIAFRNFTTDGFILEIDDILVEASDFVDFYNEKETIQFNVYPNPTTEYLRTTIHSNTLAVYDLSGKLLLQTDKDWIDVRSLENGTYLITATDSQHTFKSTFIKK